MLGTQSDAESMREMIICVRETIAATSSALHKKMCSLHWQIVARMSKRRKKIKIKINNAETVLDKREVR